MQALELYEHLSKVPGNSGLCCSKYAACYRLMGDPEHAATVYQQAYEGTPRACSKFQQGIALLSAHCISCCCSALGTY